MINRNIFKDDMKNINVLFLLSYTVSVAGMELVEQLSLCHKNWNLTQHSKILHYFAQKDDVTMVQDIITHESEENKKSRHAFLHYSYDPGECYLDQYDEVEKNIKVYKKVEDISIKYAVMNNDVDACKIAIICGANVNATLQYDEPLLGFALRAKMHDIVQLLIGSQSITVKVENHRNTIVLVMDLYEYFKKRGFHD